MGFRFRKRIEIAPGFRLNISKSGESVSLGQRGATMNFGHGRRRTTIGLPGTGLSWSKSERTGAPGARSGRRIRPHHYLATFIIAAVIWAILAHLGHA